MINKKGNFPDVVTYIETVFALIIVFGIVLLFFTNFNDTVQSNTEIDSSIKTTSSEYNSFLPSAMDYLFLFIIIIFVGFSAFAARLIPSSPFFIMVTVFAMILLPFGGMIAANFFDAWINTPQIASVMSSMKFTPFILDHFVVFVLFYTFIIGIALLSKEKQQ